MNGLAAQARVTKIYRRLNQDPARARIDITWVDDAGRERREEWKTTYSYDFNPSLRVGALIDIKYSRENERLGTFVVGDDEWFASDLTTGTHVLACAVGLFLIMLFV